MAAMRPCTLFAAACASVLPAQAPAGAVLLLRDPSGAAIGGAEGRFRLERAAVLVALRGLAIPGTQLAADEVTGTSDERGTMRLPGDDAFAATGVVTTPRGLGSLVSRLRPREARRLTLRPMGEVTTHGGSETFTLWARATLPTGERVTLPKQTGASVRLPEGGYEAWAQNRDGLAWMHLDVRSGQRSLLSFVGPAQLVRTRAGTTMHPAGWPEIDVLAGTREVSLLATALAAPFVTLLHGRSSGERVLPGPLSREALAWPPPDDAETTPIAIELGSEAAGVEQATLIGLRRNAAGGWQVAGVASAHAGRFLLPPPPPGDTWLLLLARDCAPRAVSWSPAALPQRLVASPGVPLVVHARDEQGLPAVDVAVDYVPDLMEPATVAGHTDGRGEARLGRVLGPGVLRISDARFANQSIDLATIPADGVAITVTPGLELRGVARWADGAPAAGAVVTLRDPTGLLRPPQRAVVSGDGGTFSFAGLRENRAMVLFATAQRDGRTWSGKLDRLRGGGEDVELILRDEDPVLLPPERPGGR